MLRHTLAPAIVLMNRLSYPKKFVLIGLICFVPLLGLAGLQLYENQIDKQATESGINGVQQLRGAIGLSELAAEYRDLQNAVAGSAAAAEDDKRIRKVQQRLNQALESMQQQILPSDVTERIAQIRTLVNQQLTGTITEIDSRFQRLNRPVQESWILIRQIGATSGLNRDADSRVFMLMKLIFDEMESTLEHQGQLRSYGSQGLRQGVMNSRLEISLNRLLDSLDMDRNRLDALLSPLLSPVEPGAVKGTARMVQAAVAELNLQLQQSVRVLEDELILSDELNTPWAQYFDDSSAASHAVYRFIEAALDEVDAALADRYRQQQNQFLLLAGGVLGILLISGYLMGGFVLSIRRSIGEILVSAQRVARGDLTTQVVLNNRDELGLLGKEFNQMVARVHDLIDEVSRTTDSVNAQADSVTGIAHQSRSVVETQRSETGQVATAVSQMVASVEEVARGAQSASEQSLRVSEQVSRGQQLVQTTLSDIERVSADIDRSVQVIHRLVKDSDSISRVLDVIKSVAEQTNLLALNAAIEAARAGEQGRGFAVVADEVRTLAQRTQQSTHEIEQMVTGLQTGVGDAVQAMEVSQDNVRHTVSQSLEVGQSLAEITEAIGAITDINTRIAGAAEQQTAVACEIDRKVVSISAVGDQTAAGASGTVDACRTMTEQTRQLLGMVASFKV